MASDNNPYSREHTSVDLGGSFGEEPRIPGAKPDGASDISDASSQSPLAQDRGGSDPTNIGPGNVRMGMK